MTPKVLVAYAKMKADDICVRNYRTSRTQDPRSLRNPEPVERHPDTKRCDRM